MLNVLGDDRRRKRVGFFDAIPPSVSIPVLSIA